MSATADKVLDQKVRSPARGRPAGATRKGLETRVRIIKGAREALEEGGMEALTTTSHRRLGRREARDPALLF